MVGVESVGLESRVSSFVEISRVKSAKLTSAESLFGSAGGGGF